LVFQVSRGTYREKGADAPRARVIGLSLVQGHLLIDIDEWLEVLFRSRLEDAQVRNIAFFTWDQEWMGLLQGTGVHTGRTLRSYFNFTRNAIVYPVPRDMERAGRSFVFQPEPQP
ncbi:MAG TPA: hypothetical protein VL359_20580, partial [bacterium]|nr:hypothetical protein [bacterium]